jgi:trigger factor
MKITLQTTDKVNGVLTAVVEPDDYQGKVKDAIKKLKKEMNMPGFRKGMVPEGLIRKKYGTSILGEEVNKVLSEELYKYIHENKVSMLGELLPREENNQVELVDGNEMTFSFDIAIAPEFEVDLTGKDKVPFYQVSVDDKTVEGQVEIYRQRGGSYEKMEEYADNDMVKGTIVEVNENGNPVEGGIEAQDVVMLPKYFKDDKQKALFDKAKLNDIITFNPSVAYADSEAEIASLLKIQKEEVAGHKGDFQFTISEITRYMPGPLNEGLFESVFPGAGIETPEQFSDKIKEQIAAQYAKQADMKFLVDLRGYLDKKVGELTFPDELLKRILKAQLKDGEKVDEQFDSDIKALKWHLIKEKLVEQLGIKVEDEDVKNTAKDVARMQFAQYGMLDIPEEYIENSAQEILKNKKQIDRLIDMCIDDKITAEAKKIVKLETKEVTFDEFSKL